MTLVLLTFLFVLAIVLGVYWAFVVRPEQAEQAAIRARLGTAQAQGSSKLLHLERPEDKLSQVKVVEEFLQRARGFSGPLDRLITQSGLRITVGALLMATALLALTAFLVVRSLTYQTLLGMAAGAVAGSIPVLLVRHARTRRMNLFEEQFPEAIDLLARALRAGHAFPTGLQLVAEEMAAPIGPEFKLVYDRQSFGMPLSEALRSMGERVPILDARMFATAVLTQRETGGNLSEVLMNLSSVIRDRFRVKRQVRVVTAHGRITGFILCALPPSLAVILSIISPQHMKTMFSDALGIQMLVVAGVLQLVGTLVIRKLVNVPY